MLARERQLDARRRSLVARADALRAESAELLSAFEPAFGAADKAARLGDWARRHAPVIGGVLLLTLALRRPKRILGLASRVWSAWQLYQGLRGRFDALIQRVGQTRRSNIQI